MSDVISAPMFSMACQPEVYACLQRWLYLATDAANFPPMSPAPKKDIYTHTHIDMFIYKMRCKIYSILGAFLFFANCHHMCRLNVIIAIGFCMRPS